jgi:4,5-DOPA dioxygenase extradiol
MKMAPVLFVSHGSPMIGIESDGFTMALENLGKKIPPPHAIVIVSAHWESDDLIFVTASKKPSLIYDFGGFPDALYQLTYPCPGDPVLAAEIVSLLNAADLPSALEPNRGLDHGVWIPLRRLFPKADIPVVQISLPMPRQPIDVFKMGQTLVPLRSRGILLVGSGGIVHNLRRLHFGDKTAAVDSWAGDFNSWVKEKIQNRNNEALFSYKNQSQATLAVPESEHFDPIFFVLGAADKAPINWVFDEFHYGNLSMGTFTAGL